MSQIEHTQHFCLFVPPTLQLNLLPHQCSPEHRSSIHPDAQTTNPGVSFTSSLIFTFHVRSISQSHSYLHAESKYVQNPATSYPFHHPHPSHLLFPQIIAMPPSVRFLFAFLAFRSVSFPHSNQNKITSCDSLILNSLTASHCT